MSNGMTSYIIPSRNERFMPHTVRDILKNSTGEIEVIVVLDGYNPDDKVIDDRVRYIINGVAKGMRSGINQAAAIARGKYLIKIDAHCSISPGFDRVLADASKPNVVSIARRGRLDALNWCEQYHDPIKKPDVDGEVLSYPDDPNDFGGTNMTGKIDNKRILAHKGIPIEPIIAFQGSQWHMERAFFERAGFMNETLFGDFWQEAQEISFNTYLCQISYCQIVKDAKYLHTHKGKNNVAAYDGKTGRGYNLKESSLKQARNAIMQFYYGDKVYENQQKPLSYLIEQFPDMPGWTSERVEALKERERAKGWKI